MIDVPHFEPKPENDFAEFIELYYTECRSRVPGIQAIAGKWRYEDLIPGLSDFDTRFIVKDGMSVDQWCDMSVQVGRVHLELCDRYPHWARNLEHLPGVNLEWRELFHPETYYPEYPQWTFYQTEDSERKKQAIDFFATRGWDDRDEYFHLKKFCTYFGRYDRKIDPPVNLGLFEDKYALHSRFLHYFCPPLQAAISLLRRRAVPGKLETVHLAAEMFPDIGVFNEMLEVIERHYEVPELYDAEGLTKLEDRLEDALFMLKHELGEAVTILPKAASTDILEWKNRLDAYQVDPILKIFDAAKFSRLMKGRLEFYAASPAHFDAVWLIENELNRIRRNFFEIPFSTFWKLRTGADGVDPMEIVTMLCPEIISTDEASCIREFDRLIGEPRDPVNLATIATGIAAVFDGFYSALDKITHAAEAYSREER